MGELLKPYAERTPRIWWRTKEGKSVKRKTAHGTCIMRFWHAVQRRKRTFRNKAQSKQKREKILPTIFNSTLASSSLSSTRKRNEESSVIHSLMQSRHSAQRCCDVNYHLELWWSQGRRSLESRKKWKLNGMKTDIQKKSTSMMMLEKRLFVSD